MNKYLLMIITFILSGCGYVNRGIATFTDYSTICIKGVTYIQFTSGATPMYNIDGKLVGC